MHVHVRGGGGRVEARVCVWGGLGSKTVCVWGGGHLLVSSALEMSWPHYPILHRNTAHSTGQLTDRVVPVYV